MPGPATWPFAGSSGEPSASQPDPWGPSASPTAPTGANPASVPSSGPWGPPGSAPVPGVDTAGEDPTSHRPAPAEADASRRSQWIAVGVLTPFLVVLFAFMFANSGPDRPDERAATETTTSSAPEWDQPPVAGGLSGVNDAAGQTPQAPGPETSAPGTAPPTTVCAPGPGRAQRLAGRGAIVDCDHGADTPSPAPGPREGGPVPGLPPARTVDRYGFCRSVAAVNTFEVRVGEAIQADVPGEVGTVVLDGRDQWRVDVDAMVASGPEDLQVAITYYREVLDEAFGSITASSSNQDVVASLAAVDSDEYRNVATEIGQRVVRDCA